VLVGPRLVALDCAVELLCSLEWLLFHWAFFCVCVDRTLDLCWSNWPFCLATDCGGWRRTYADAMSDQVVKRTASMASHQVESTVEKGDARYCGLVLHLHMRLLLLCFIAGSDLLVQ
jgi:hypothetical protein